MTNSWSFLFDELNMSNQDYWKEDGFSLTGNPGTASSDTIVFGGSRLPGGMGNDHITFSVMVLTLQNLYHLITLDQKIVFLLIYLNLLVLQFLKTRKSIVKM